MTTRELSLFTGAGGGLLGTRLLGWETIGYVEIDEYCQRVLRARRPATVRESFATFDPESRCWRTFQVPAVVEAAWKALTTEEE